jgi:putative FmdB family regulatory protein
MPIYAYRCEQCGHAKDVIQKFSDAPLTVCPSCGADAFRKQLTAPAFQLKGSGWYVTDFRDGGKKAAGARAEGASEGTADGTADVTKDGAKEGSKDSSKEGSKDGAQTGTTSGAAPESGSNAAAPSGSVTPAGGSDARPPASR